MITTMSRPLSSMNVMMTFATTDSVMPMRLTIVMIATKPTAMSAPAQMASGGSPMIPLKYRTNPEAREPTAAILAESMQIVMKKVRMGLRNALLT